MSCCFGPPPPAPKPVICGMSATEMWLSFSGDKNAGCFVRFYVLVPLHKSMQFSHFSLLHTNTHRHKQPSGFRDKEYSIWALYKSVFTREKYMYFFSSYYWVWGIGETEIQTEPRKKLNTVHLKSQGFWTQTKTPVFFLFPIRVSPFLTSWISVGLREGSKLKMGVFLWGGDRKGFVFLFCFSSGLLNTNVCSPGLCAVSAKFYLQSGLNMWRFSPNRESQISEPQHSLIWSEALFKDSNLKLKLKHKNVKTKKSKKKKRVKKDKIHK